MMLFLTIVGIGLALLVFLKSMQVGDTTLSKSAKFDETNPPVLNARKVLTMPSGEMRPRVCPVCGTVLSQTDYLIAALEPEPKTERKRQAHIYGCRYCVSSGGVNLKQRELTHIEP